MRKSSLFFIHITVLLLLFCLSFVDTGLRSRYANEKRTQSIELVRKLGLTDLALFTEARYTRHPSQADLNSAFQDHPLALEHFPTGSLVGPPAHLRR